MKDNQLENIFSEETLWKKIKNFSKSAGIKVVYAALLLYYVMSDTKVGLKTKISIAAALGYFILPTDAIFDLTPLIGYTDDLGVLIFMLTQVASNITAEVRENARKKLSEWFGEIDTNELQELEKHII